MRTSSHFLENESISIENESVCCADNKNHIEPSDKKKHFVGVTGIHISSFSFYPFYFFAFPVTLFCLTFKLIHWHHVCSYNQLCIFQNTQRYLCLYPSNTEASVIVVHYRLHYRSHYSFTRFRQPIFSAVWPSTFSSSIHLIRRKYRKCFSINILPWLTWLRCFIRTNFNGNDESVIYLDIWYDLWNFLFYLISNKIKLCCRYKRLFHCDIIIFRK